MKGIITEDMPELGLKAGDMVRIVSTSKKLGRTTIKTATDTLITLDSWRVQVVP